MERVGHSLEWALIEARQRSDRLAIEIAIAMGRKIINVHQPDIEGMDLSLANWQQFFMHEAVDAGVDEELLERFEESWEAEIVAQDACFRWYEEGVE